MSCILEAWSHVTADAASQTVFPDGCRDLILTVDASGRPDWHISDLHLSPLYLAVEAGVAFYGLRLHPGVAIDEARLLADVHARQPDAVEMVALVEEHCRRSPSIGEAIDCLAESASVAQAANRLGVGIRTLQRLFETHGQMPPEFWFLLSRARRAAAMTALDASLADVAAAAGYSDQAHMTREFARWFELSPGRMRAQHAARESIDQPGLGTGVQISTRMPLGSLT